MKKKIIFWFRNDLRVSDNPGLWHAAHDGIVLPVYVITEKIAPGYSLGSASKVWLHHALESLQASLDTTLHVFESASPQQILTALVKQHAIDAIYCNVSYEPLQHAQDQAIEKAMVKIGVEFKVFEGTMLWNPTTILTGSKTYYKRYTPYLNACLQSNDEPRKIVGAPRKIEYIRAKQEHKLDSFGLVFKKLESFKNLETEKITEAAAHKALQTFIKKKLDKYDKQRNYPALSHTSQLSAYLHFGQLSPHQVWHAVHAADDVSTVDKKSFLSEIVWREFSYYLLYHFPTLPDANFNSKFDNFAWSHNKKWLTAWQEGRTGYPIVDAGMRELLHTGTMHNRVRMIVGSFLIKNLLIDWRHGAQWFFDRLYDADIASNSFNWQWVAGSGVDAAPYFRIFNPTLQAKTYDPTGDYIRTHVPELARVPDKYLTAVWLAPESVLKSAGIVLDKTYPRPIVDIAESRAKALKIYAGL